MRLYLGFTLACLLFSSALEAAEDQSWRDAYAAALATVTAGAESQRNIDRVVRNRDTLKNQLAETTLRNDFADQRIAELEREQFRRAAEISQLEERLRAGELTRLELLPLLREMLNALDTFISRDLPFERDKRAARVASTRALLDNHALSLEQKLLNVFELYRDEIDTSAVLATSQGRIQLDGSIRDVALLRAGRIALYCMTPDAKTVGIWNRETGAWQTLPPPYSDAVADAFAMARNKTWTEAPAFPVLPAASR